MIHAFQHIGLVQSRHHNHYIYCN